MNDDILAGESSVSHSVSATSSRRIRGRWLAGVAATTLLSASISSIGTVAQGIGFAVPIDVAADIMAQARSTVGVA
ncbi:MAG: hypothetical protein ACRDIL_03530 [Candidatus Limnocylindrales bacterium]